MLRNARNKTAVAAGALTAIGAGFALGSFLPISGLLAAAGSVAGLSIGAGIIHKLAKKDLSQELYEKFFANLPQLKALFEAKPELKDGFQAYLQKADAKLPSVEERKKLINVLANLTESPSPGDAGREARTAIKAAFGDPLPPDIAAWLTDHNLTSAGINGTLAASATLSRLRAEARYLQFMTRPDIVHAPALRTILKNSVLKDHFISHLENNDAPTPQQMSALWKKLKAVDPTRDAPAAHSALVEAFSIQPRTTPPPLHLLPLDTTSFVNDLNNANVFNNQSIFHDLVSESRLAAFIEDGAAPFKDTGFFDLPGVRNALIAKYNDAKHADLTIDQVREMRDKLITIDLKTDQKTATSNTRTALGSFGLTEDQLTTAKITESHFETIRKLKAGALYDKFLEEMGVPALRAFF